MTGLLGGTFNPPHNGHLALARAAQEHFGLDDLVVLVAERPGHKEVQLDAGTRLTACAGCLPRLQGRARSDERTVDMLRAGDWSEPLFLIGADQFVDFLTWKDPEGVLALARIGSRDATRLSAERLDAVLQQLSRTDRVEMFEMSVRLVREIRTASAAASGSTGSCPGHRRVDQSLGLYGGKGAVALRPYPTS